MTFTIIQRNLTRKLHTKKNMTITKASDCDKPEIWNFMKDVFFKTEPSSIICGVAKKNQVSDELLKLVTSRIDENKSFIARFDESGKSVAGIAVNGVRSTEWNFDLWTESTKDVTCEKERELLLFWQKLSKLPQNPNQYFEDISELFELEYLSVEPSFQRQGIAKAMLVRSLEEAKENGFRFLRMDCTSAYSAALAQRAGMKQIDEIYYKDLKDSSGKPFQNIQQPHIKAAIMVADLQKA